ncbi:ABC transporter ATP-binding protein [Streptomyces sp. NPDC101225]|uniref:ABC transporter ATP-binding protein n=1 Tax=Streptomyces sp. NPDC101225 TaxID=3366135 RepID=UPI00381B03C5
MNGTPPAGRTGPIPSALTAGSAPAPVLQTTGLGRRFGGLQAVSDVDLSIPPGRTIGVIGPNGAGKSTLINLITGHLTPSSGRVLINGVDLTGARPWRVAHAGVARTFQIVKPFRGLTVCDNVAVAALFGPSPARTPTAARKEAAQVLERVGLGGKDPLTTAELSVADARRLELAKALALQPKLLLLDEVLAGLRPVEIDASLQLIDDLKKAGLTLLVVEHIVQAITAVSDEILVLHHGQVLMHGAPDHVLGDERVIEAYLGRRYAKRNRT